MRNEEVCIYCGSSNVNKSDIIPSALTKKKFIRRNVCYFHNARINEEAEKIIISRLANVRNDLNIPTRKGNDVPYQAKIIINDKEFFVDNFIGVLDLMNNGIDCVDNDGKTVHIGKIDITKIESYKDLEYFNENTTISSSFNFDFSIFKSVEMLRMIAKIGYEWFCNKFNVAYNKSNKKYSQIINYIMRENLSNPIDVSIVQIVTDERFYQQLYNEVDCGTHALSITRDANGMVYVILVFWGIIAYKIKIGYVGEIYISRSIRYDFDCIRYDGSTYILPVPKLLNILEIASSSVDSGFDTVLSSLRQRFETLFSESLITKNNLKRTIYKIRNILSTPEDDSTKINSLFGIIDFTNGIALYILLLLSKHSADYNFSDTFNNNLKNILKTNEKHYTSIPELTKLFREKIQNGTILAEIQKGMNIFSKLK